MPLDPSRRYNGRSMSTAIVFPGQGAQKRGMGSSLYQDHPAARGVFDRVSRITGIDLASLCFEADEDTLRQTSNTQLALFTVSCATWFALSSEHSSLAPGGAAGHSVGEYAALVCASVISLEDGAGLVARRGELMHQAAVNNPGAMAAVLGLPLDDVHRACEQATANAIVVVANDNCPGQVVISGDRIAVERATEIAKEMGAKRAISLNVSGAFHSPLMQTAIPGMRAALAGVEFKPGKWPVVSNVTAAPVTAPDEWRELLAAQIASRVRWTESVLSLRDLGCGTFFECGVGEALTGLLKRIDPTAAGTAIVDAPSLKSVQITNFP